MSDLSQNNNFPTEVQMLNAMQAYIDALNAKDIEGIISLFSEGGTIEDPVGTVIEDATSGLTRLVGALPPDATFKLDSVIRSSHSNGAAMAFTVNLNYQGQAMEIKSIDVMQFDNEGKIREMKAYYGPSNVTTTPLQ